MIGHSYFFYGFFVLLLTKCKYKTVVDKNIAFFIGDIWKLLLMFVSLHYVFHIFRFLRLTKVGAKRCSFFYVLLE